MTDTHDQALPLVAGFDPAMAGRRAECDGGGPVEGTRYAARQDFAGTQHPIWAISVMSATCRM